jgi:putative transposase
MDFVHDQLSNGRAFRVLCVIDNWSRQSLLLEVGFRLTGSSVVQALNCVSNEGRLPQSITVDHGPEFTSVWKYVSPAALLPEDDRISCRAF